jgi:hypothetical protein
MEVERAVTSRPSVDAAESCRVSRSWTGIYPVSLPPSPSSASDQRSGGAPAPEMENPPSEGGASASAHQAPPARRRRLPPPLASDKQASPELAAATPDRGTPCPQHDSASHSHQAEISQLWEDVEQLKAQLEAREQEEARLRAENDGLRVRTRVARYFEGPWARHRAQSSTV